MTSLPSGLKIWGEGWMGQQGPHLDLVHISNPSPGLSKSLLESLDIGQVNRDVFCLMNYGLKRGWWMLLPKGRKKEASVWDGLCDQKPSLTFGYSSMSPCGCHLGLLACILPTSGCQSLLVPYSRTKTSAVPPCCLSTRLSTCWQCLHTQPVVLIWELQFVRLSHVWGLSTDRCSSARWYFS